MFLCVNIIVIMIILYYIQKYYNRHDYFLGSFNTPYQMPDNDFEPEQIGGAGASYYGTEPTHYLQHKVNLH